MTLEGQKPKFLDCSGLYLVSFLALDNATTNGVAAVAVEISLQLIRKLLTTCLSKVTTTQQNQTNPKPQPKPKQNRKNSPRSCVRKSPTQQPKRELPFRQDNNYRLFKVQSTKPTQNKPKNFNKNNISSIRQIFPESN